MREIREEKAADLWAAWEWKRTLYWPLAVPCKHSSIPPLPMPPQRLCSRPCPAKHAGHTQLTCLTLLDPSCAMMASQPAFCHPNRVTFPHPHSHSSGFAAFPGAHPTLVPFEIVRFNPVSYDVRKTVMLEIPDGALGGYGGRPRRPSPLTSRAT